MRSRPGASSRHAYVTPSGLRNGLIGKLLVVIMSSLRDFKPFAALPYFAVLLFCLSAILSSCTTRDVEPTRQSRHTIDTLFQQQIIVLKPEMDKSCDSLYASVYKNAIDSIETARRIEIDSLTR